MVTFWLDNPSAAFSLGEMLDFTPIIGSTLEERLNSVFRFSVYLGVIAALVARDYRYLIIPAIVAPITIIAYRTQEVSAFTQRPCTRPTADNPFMNVLMSDYGSPRAEACNASVPATQCDISRLFDDGLTRAPEDLFKRGASDRQYYTNPVTTIPNDSESFAKWLYGAGLSKSESVATSYSPAPAINF
jgi:hypothetical protein